MNNLHMYHLVWLCETPYVRSTSRLSGGGGRGGRGGDVFKEPVHPAYVSGIDPSPDLTRRGYAHFYK